MLRHWNTSKLILVLAIAGLLISCFGESTLLAQENAGVSVSFSDASNKSVRVTFSDDQSAKSNSKLNQVRPTAYQDSDFEPKQTDQTPSPSTPEKTEPPSPDTDAENGLESDDSNSARSRQLKSDEPTAPPTFNLRDDAEEEIDDEPAADKVSEATNDSYQLPTLGDVNSPIPQIALMGITQSDPSGLLSNDGLQSQSNGLVNQSTTYSSLKFAPNQQKVKTWKAHNFYHRPMYFEDKNLERYGNEMAFQNIASGARFLISIPTLPYRIGETHPNSRVYTYGNGRPGDYVPYHLEGRTPSRRGAALQTVVSLGILLP